jgi:hypothetical protein
MMTNDTPIDTKRKEGLKTYAKYIAMVLHNTAEDLQKKRPSDQPGEQLDSPTIRNALYTALYAFEYYKYSDAAREFVDYNLWTIPCSWPDPEFSEGFEAEHEDKDSS